MDQSVSQQTLAEMKDYYRARAGEYDQWFYRQGRYDRGAQNNQKWFAECDEVLRALHHAQLTGDILELACGTGIWTQHLVHHSSSMMAVDASAEVIKINRQKVGDNRVEYVQADLFAWKPPRRFDAVFFGFWLSHVPIENLQSFWTTVGKSLQPDGKVYFVDSLCSKTSGASNHQHASDGQLQHRKLDDGREYRIVKVFYEPREIEIAAAQAGIRMNIHRTSEYFLYGSGTKSTYS